ncbi:MAM and LDL-receptor class A domain-containing protein 1-like [Rhipicephalus sanguineus]|uniref:MAM and LDL-receptor class A domain-containing protein 1-like n=1 Tax=Rhipicephalus sanguineus TaxID=34632 RepID=UPI0020C2F584|nr:MAM and LDL-receptor class A domain-containing protein 1-like [Rhipicephalus sanguineus]
MDGSCDFDWGDTCGYNLGHGKFSEWLLQDENHTIITPDYSTNTPSGGFVLVKSPGGRMVSPENWYDGHQLKCFRFWYFLTGTSAEELTVTEVNRERQEVELWRGTPPKDNSRHWRQASVTIQTYNKTPTIIFDATTSDSAGAIVALDDISLGNSPCPSPGSCSFEEDMCDWASYKIRRSALWYRHRGATISNTTGVQEDHTLGTAKGYYLLLDAADLADHGYGSVHSEMLSLGPSACVSLYYSMKKGSGALLILGFFNETGASLGRQQVVEASATGEWTRLTVERSDMPNVFSVVISGENARGRSDVIIDDIDVRRGECGETALTTIVTTPEPPTVPAQVVTSESRPSVTPGPVSSETPEPVPSEAPEPLPSETPVPVATETPAPAEPKPAVECRRGEFSCGDDSTCIPSALLCDGVKDCPNGLDEKCGSTMQCKENEFYCATGYPGTCMPRSLLCDGREDCDGGSDESLCRACPHYFCLNGGICGWTPKAPSPACDCRDGYEGRRCNVLTRTMPDMGKLASKGSESIAGIATGVVLALAVLITAAVAAFVLIRKRRNAEDPPLILNPSYDASTSETTFFK